MLHLAVEDAFEDLLATWRTHESRRQNTRTALADLVQSRHALDQARERMHKLRSTIYPEGKEREAVVESVWCETLEVVVHLRWIDRHPTRPGNFTCSCGHLVPVNYSKTGTGPTAPG